MTRAMIFAAGVGSRLKPFTDHHPKALAPVGGTPMLGRVIGKLKASGITDMVVNVHHFADQIADYLQTNDNFGINISLSNERAMLLDTGGGLLYAAGMLAGSDCLVLHNADIFTDFDINGLTAMQTSVKPLASLLVAPRDTSRYLLFDHRMCMQGWTNISTGQLRPTGIDPSGCTPLAFGGVHAVDGHSIFDLLQQYNDSLRQAEPRRESLDGVCKFSITDFYIDMCRSHAILGYTPQQQYRWVDIGRADSLALADSLVHGS